MHNNPNTAIDTLCKIIKCFTGIIYCSEGYGIIIHDSNLFPVYLPMLLSFLTHNITCISESCIEIKTKLNFYFHTSLWCLKRFFEGL